MKRFRAPLAFVLTLACPYASAQSLPPSTAAGNSRILAFDTVSIRPSDTGGDHGPSLKWGIEPDGYRTHNQTIWSTIMIAYFPQGMASWTADRLKGAPEWIGSEQYDINAKVSADDLPAWQRQGKTLEQQEVFRSMLQTMLAERCKLGFHRIPNEVTGLLLMIGKRGPQFKPTPADEAVPSGGMRLPDGGTILTEEQGHTKRFYGVTMERLGWYLSTFSYPRLTIQDRTGLTGRYDFVLHLPDTAPGDPDSGGTLAWDLKPLGLEFQQIKLPMDTLVIDHIERPSEN